MEKNLKPSTNKEVQDISVECFEWWKKYYKYTNASPDKNLHFSEKLWEEIIGFTDADGVYHMGTFDQVYYRHPCEFTYNMLSAFLLELQARDRGAYNREEEIEI